MSPRRKRTPVPWLPSKSPEGHTFAADDERHGSLHGYGNLRCRCSECRAAGSAVILEYRARRAERLRRDPTVAPHGTADTYRNWGCRCNECRIAINIANGGSGQRRKSPSHGDRSMYQHHGCRCDDCRRAEADYRREHRRSLREAKAKS